MISSSRFLVEDDLSSCCWIEQRQRSRSLLSWFFEDMSNSERCFCQMTRWSLSLFDIVSILHLNWKKTSYWTLTALDSSMCLAHEYACQVYPQNFVATEWTPWNDGLTLRGLWHLQDYTQQWLELEPLCMSCQSNSSCPMPLQREGVHRSLPCR